jgi:hypothetical protein
VADGAPRPGSTTATAGLARAGLIDSDAARLHLTRLGPVPEDVLVALSNSPDPDLALRGLAMEGRELVAETLGEHVFNFFLRNKRAEWRDYRRQVTQFELDRLLPVL